MLYVPSNVTSKSVCGKLVQERKTLYVDMTFAISAGRHKSDPLLLKTRCQCMNVQRQLDVESLAPDQLSTVAIRN